MVLVCLSIQIKAQNWELDLKKELYEISWMRQGVDGTLLVAGNKGMAGVDPESGEVKWINQDLVAVELASYTPIDYLPLFVVKSTQFFGNSTVIVNSNTGEPILKEDSKDYTVMNHTVMPENGLILIETKKDKKYGLRSFYLSDNSLSGTIDLGKAKGGISGFLKGKTSFLSGVVSAGPDAYIVLYKERIMKIDAKAHTIVWEKEYKDDVDNAAVDNGKVYLGYGKYLDVLDLASGKSDLDKPIKLRGEFQNIMKGDEGLFVFRDNGFNIYLPSKGEMKWKKPYKGRAVDEVIRTKAGFVSVVNTEKFTDLVLVDFENGKKEWDSRLSGSKYYSMLTPEGILLITSERSNVYELKKGKKINRKDLMIRGVPAMSYDEENNNVVVFSNKKLSTINTVTGKSNLIAEKIKLKKFKDDEDRAYVEKRDGGYLISTSQNAAFIKDNGSEAYNQYYKPVSSSNAALALSQLAADVAGVDVDIAHTMRQYEALSALSSGALLSASSDGARTNTKTTLGASIGGNTVLAINNTKYFATKEDPNHLYIFTKGDKTNKIVKVSKDSGKTVYTLKTKDKSPIYQLDNVLNSIILVKGKNKLKSVSTIK